MRQQDADETQPLREEPERRRFFGARLRELRETYAERISSGGSAMPLLRARPTASALIDCMRENRGFSISAAAYNEIENGLNVPRDAVGFLDAVAVCLRLDDADKADLARRLAFDLLSSRLRHLTPQVFPPDPSWERSL
jgi:hypothetical protein